MICPVEIANAMSAFRAVVGEHARHELLHTSRHGAGAGAVAGALFRSECAALSPEAGGRASDSAQLQLGERDSARSGDGGRWAQARNAPQTTTATTLAGDAAAQRRQPAPLVGRGALARSDRDSG